MRKILKTQGSLNQWIDLVSLSLEQMGLNTEIENNIILAMHNGLQVMKFELTESDGVILAIDYFDDRDLDDFKKFAAQIITDPDSYRNASKTRQNTKSLSTAENNVLQYNQNKPDNQKKTSGKKGLKIALIIVCALVLLAAAGFGGYKIYQSKNIPKEMLSEAMVAYNNGDYKTAILISDDIIATYPDSKQASDAQTLKANAEAELESIELQNQTAEKIADYQAHFRMVSSILSGPDENGDVSLLLDYTNTSTADLSSVTFGVRFLDANGSPVMVEGADSDIIACTDSTPLAPGQSKGAGNLQFGPYRNSTIASFAIVSLTATYSDGYTLNLTTPDEVAWIMPQQ